ncbi:MAG: hypothetical protein ACHP9Y_02210, partial [Gammaproteobacteria bacterium]
MDNFDWLEEEKKKQKPQAPQWLREYWLHITALVIIFVVLIFLIFNPASKSVTHENATTSTTLTTNQGDNKQILIRMPDKSTKLANAEPNNPEQQQPQQ